MIYCIVRPAINYDILSMLSDLIINKKTLSGKEDKYYLEELEKLFNTTNTLEHLHYSFVFASSPFGLLDILVNSNLKLLYTNNNNNNTLITIVSGSLEEWRKLIINFSSSFVQYEIRNLVNEIQLFFERELQMYLLFSGYRKNGMKDGTFYLTEIKQ